MSHEDPFNDQTVIFKADDDLFKSISVTQFLTNYIHTIISGENMSNIPINADSPISSNFTIYPYKNHPGETPAPYNVYISHDETVPTGTFIVDYFSSGQIFCNLKEYSLIAALDTIQTLYRNFFFSQSKDLSSPPPSLDYTSSSLSIAKAILSPTSDEVLAWQLPLDTFFKYEYKVQEIPVCSHYTYQDSKPVLIVSKNYPYANVVQDSPHCSHPDIQQKGSFTSCFMSSNQSACVNYSPNIVFISKTNVTPLNTSEVISFALTYSLSSFGAHLFQIKNITHNTLLNTLSYPSSFEYDDCLSEAQKIYQEYLDVYSQDVLVSDDLSISVVNDSSKDLQKTSYISSLALG